ncbi:MAG: TRAP transporter substrate-binding protein DctP [Planctomycetota bacterium]|nr:TRAP transporter substrate-binding protein DctP [Planctomycetota bacterium]
MITILGLVSALSFAPAPVPARAAAPAVDRKPTKLATLVPKGSSYHKSLLAMAEAWKGGPDGGAPVTIYPDGTMGGEADMVRRMRAGQLQAALISVTGLREIDPSVTALQNLPLLFENLDEAAAVRTMLLPRIEKTLADKGFVSLFFGDVGWVRFFTKEPVKTPDDMKRVKFFTWSGSTDQADFMKGMGWNPVLLETADILPGLQTGLIDGAPVVPFFALKAQLFGVAKNMLEIDWAPLVGALVVTQKAWNELPPSLREHCRASAARTGAEITENSRKENDEAVEAMKKRGLVVQPMTPELKAGWRAFMEPIWPKLRGLDVPADLYDEVMRIVAELRAAKR